MTHWRKAATFAVLVAVPMRSDAFVVAAVEAAKTAKDATYQKFMMLKAVQQLKAMRDNYTASVRYYDYVRKLNEGKGLLPNIAAKVGSVAKETAYDARIQAEDDWLKDEGHGSGLDRSVRGMDDYLSAKVRFAAESYQKALESQEAAERIAVEAPTLDGKSADRMSLKTQALQMQMMAQMSANLAQILDVQTKMQQAAVQEKQQRDDEWSVFQKSMRRAGLGLSEQANTIRQSLWGE